MWRWLCAICLINWSINTYSNLISNAEKGKSIWLKFKTIKRSMVCHLLDGKVWEAGKSDFYLYHPNAKDVQSVLTV